MAKLAALLVFLFGFSACAATPKVAYYRLRGSIDDVSAKETAAVIRAAGKAHMKALVIDINSPGGRVDEGFEIAKAIENSPVPIICVVDGEAMSMAFYILQSCPTRIMTRRSLLMTHMPHYPVQNARLTAPALEHMKASLKALGEAMAEHVIHRMKITMDAYLKKVANDTDWTMGYKEALEVGAIDEVVDSIFVVTNRLQK